jgi:hypothetical protein
MGKIKTRLIHEAVLLLSNVLHKFSRLVVGRKKIHQFHFWGNGAGIFSATKGGERD